MSSRPTLQGARHAASCGHYLATSAAFAMLEDGGNAVDAGCAAVIALSVLQPDIVSFGGICPMILRTPDGRVETIAGVGAWPQALPDGVFMSEHGGTIPSGVRRAVVPGAPDAWLTALARHGSRSFAEVAAPALELARDGFAVHEYLAHSARKRRDQYARWPQNAALFAPGGLPLAEGDWLQQPELADCIDLMIAAEARAGGSRAQGLAAARRAFYEGDIAQAIVAQQVAEDGFMTLDDLRAHAADLGGGITRRWREVTLTTCEPWSQGPVLIHALLIAEAAGIATLPHNGPAYIHTLTESIRAAMADRETFYGDPRHVDVSMDALLAPERIAAQAAAIDPVRAAERPAATPLSDAPLPTVDSDTSHACVVDRNGLAFSATPSDVCAEMPLVPGLGFAVSARGNQSRPDPTDIRGARAGRRPRITPSPALALLPGGDVMAFGTPGADMQPQAMAQVLLNLHQFGMPPQDAIEAPRFGSYGFPSSSAPYADRGRRLALEGRIPPETAQSLAALGHETETWPDHARMAGSVQLVIRNETTGRVAAGADPRRPAYAIVH